MGPEFTDHQALVSATVGVYQHNTAFANTLQCWAPSTTPGFGWTDRLCANQSMYIVQYQHRESAVISAGMGFDSASKGIFFTTLPCDPMQEMLRQLILSMVEAKVATGDDTWRLHAGFVWGAAAMHSMAHWLFAHLLHQASATSEPPPAPNTTTSPTLDDLLGRAIPLYAPARAEHFSRQDGPDSPILF